MWCDWDANIRTTFDPDVGIYFHRTEWNKTKKNVFISGLKCRNNVGFNDLGHTP